MDSETPKLFSSFDVVKDERSRILNRRTKAGYKKPGRPDCDAMGLALSGGGIRSATFNLGILQALDRVGLLRCIDYLSTVSGGGYIGSSLTWFMSRLKASVFPFDTINPVTDALANRLLARFRARGNYMTPGDGLTWWALVAAILTGIIVNLIVVIPIFFFILWILGMGLPELPYFLDRLVGGVPYAQREGPTWFTALLFLGMVVVLVSLVAGVLFSMTTRFAAARNCSFQRWTNKAMGRGLMYGAIGVIIGTIPIVTVILEIYLHGWVHSAMSSISLAGILSIWGGITGKKHGNEAKGVRSFLLSFGLSLLMYGIFLWLFYITRRFDPGAAVYFTALGCSLLIAYCADINHVSMHRFYRNRLMEAYLPMRVRDDWGREENISIMDESVTPPVPASERDADLCLLHAIPQTAAPYHLINATIQTVGSRLPKLKERGGHSFIFSPLFCGSDCTSYARSKDYIKGKVNLATAMAISGAAVDPNTYATRSRPLTFLMTLLNVRLGYWIRNPQTTALGNVQWRNPSWYKIFSEMLGRGLNENSSSLHLSDGGHFENLGLYELIRRECKYIIVCDATADVNYVFDDLAKAVERVRVDFGAEITIDTRPIRPVNKVRKISREACVVGGIRYKSGLEGVIVYVNTTLVEKLTEDIYAYQRQNPAFPDQGTGDQFFGEQQFEAYRELGLQLGVRYFSKLVVPGGPLDLLNL
ncbi:MAG: patatin-like phospholipase family protein [Deltaproteobacteria bacterium]|nr:patatin-like phospholipase family protein [Deltaproteobacteria bacterium]